MMQAALVSHVRLNFENWNPFSLTRETEPPGGRKLLHRNPGQPGFHVFGPAKIPANYPQCSRFHAPFPMRRMAMPDPPPK